MDRLFTVFSGSWVVMHAHRALSVPRGQVHAPLLLAVESSESAGVLGPVIAFLRAQVVVLGVLGVNVLGLVSVDLGSILAREELLAERTPFLEGAPLGMMH